MSIDSGIGTKREFDLIDLACARAAAVMSGGMWTFEGDRLVRIFPPEAAAPARDRFREHLDRIRSLIDATDGTDRCRVFGCFEKPFSLRMCQRHYHRWYRAGKPDLGQWIASAGGAA